jgi:hypothetical protein
MTLNEFLSRLEDVHSSPAGHSARCPGHPDRVRSLTVSAGTDGRVLVWCFAGCGMEAIVAALGLTARDLFPTPEPVDQPTPGLTLACTAWSTST